MCELTSASTWLGWLLNTVEAFFPEEFSLHKNGMLSSLTAKLKTKLLYANLGSAL